MDHILQAGVRFQQWVVCRRVERRMVRFLPAAAIPAAGA